MRTKKITSIILLILVALVLVSCKKKPSNNNDDLPPSNEIHYSGNIIKEEDENDPNYLDGYRYKYTGTWSSEDGEYESINGEFKYAGLYNPDGTVYEMPKENEVTGTTYNVIDFGAKADDDTFDNTSVIKTIIEFAQEGDEIYFPEGRFYFSDYMTAKPVMSHISLPSGVNLRGAGSEKTTLVSKFNHEQNKSNDTATIGILSESNIKISNIALDAEIPEELMPEINEDGTINTLQNNPDGNKYVPKSGIKAFNDDPLEKTENIVVDNVSIEHFSYSGVYFKSTIASVVRNSKIKNATDVGGGGRGYGITVEGQGHEAFYAVGGNLGSRYNLVENNYVEGPYIRHSIILSYGTHNNLIYNNVAVESQDQTLDLHGQDEFLNVFTNNDLKDGAKQAIGLGNSGFTHDLTGPANVFYNNTIDNYSDGISISYGTLESIIENNKILNLGKNGIGIDVRHGPNSNIINNEIDTIPGKDAVGIYVKYSYVYYAPEEGVYDVFISENKINNIDEGVGMILEVYGENSKIENNTIENVKEITIDTKDTFDVPEKSDYTTEVLGEVVNPTKEANINRGDYTRVVRNRGYFWFKGSELEREFNRMIYYNFNLSDQIENIEETDKIVIRLTVSSKSALQHFHFYGIEDFSDEWDENTMTWENAPFVNNPTNNPELEFDPTGEYSTSEYPYYSEVYDPEDLLSLITDFKVPVVDESFLTYYVDITDYVKNLETFNFTMILANPTIDEAYSSVRNMIGNPKDVWPAIIIED